ncbi:MAG: respiratory nitrate reductase subunit gamma [Deltaproteobacteria bacterium]|nr:respiratory nitrate reductase subunit gamma [Deltaproteobacteria bacterium]
MHYSYHWAFYAVSGVAVLVFFAGAAELAHLVLVGRGEPVGHTTPGRLARRLVSGVLFQRQVAEGGALVWAAHLLMVYGFAGLFLLTVAQFLLRWFVSAPGVLEFFTHGAGAAAMAVWGDAFGLALLSGTVLALFRRYVLRPEHLDTVAEDALAVWLLFAVAATGFACEIVRLGARPQTVDLSWSFAVAWMLPGQAVFSETLVSAAFWFHGLVSLFFIAAIPFTKLKHLFTSPVVYAAVTSSDHYTRS